MSGARKRKWGITVAALVVVTTLLVTGWLHWSRRQEVAASLSSSAPPAPHVAESRFRIPRDAIPAASAPTHAPSADSASNVDVCGIQKARPAGADAEDVNDDVIAATRETHDRWKAALLDSPDTRARAVGLLLQRFESLRDDSAVQAEESRDELVQLAAGGSDPALYAIAVGLCQTNEVSDAVTTGACQRISLTEWSRTDPGNAMPWIAVAQAARARGDFQAEAAAFTRGAEARTMRSPGESMFQFGLQEVPRDATPAEKASLSIELIGQEVAFIGPELSEVMRYCSADAIKQTQIRKDCTAVAELLVGPETTLLYFSLGAKLGERVGWPVERVHQLTDEKEELLRLAASNTLIPRSCDAISRINTFINERERLGEIGALRELRDQREPSAQPVSR
jgi:hypothetical protein